MTKQLALVAEVRRACGITTDNISDEDFKAMIDKHRKNSSENFNIKIEPTKNIEIIKVISQDYVNTKKNPILAVTRLRQNDLDVELDEVQFNSLGTIRRDFRVWKHINSVNRRNNMVNIEYYYGWVEPKDYKEMTTNVLAPGSNIIIDVISIGEYEVDDWVRLIGLDGNIDVAKITKVDTTLKQITVDKIVLSHEIDTLLEILDAPQLIKSHIINETAIEGVVNVSGGTYTLNSSASLGPLSTVKGIPLTHWAEVFRQLQKKKEELEYKINSKLVA